VATFLKELRTRLLSYSMFEHSLDDKPDLLTNEAAAPSHRLTKCCDICGIDLATYYSQYARDAFLLAYFRKDGTLGSVCHLCSNGW
jgi:hypothetical protein